MNSLYQNMLSQLNHAFIPQDFLWPHHVYMAYIHAY